MKHKNNLGSPILNKTIGPFLNQFMYLWINIIYC